MKQKKLLKNKEGITLIALVVTIVILLTLAGITISGTMGEGGLIERTKIAVNKTNDGVNNDMTAINEFNDQLGGLISEMRNERELDQLEECKENAMLTNTQITLGSYQVTIPKGYRVAETSGNTVKEGIVITDAEINGNNGNEWVWVPVSNEELDNMYVESASYVQLSGTSATNAKTKYYTASGIIAGKTRTTPGSASGYREPDLVVGTGTQYDAVDANRITAGFEENNVAYTLDQMAAQMAEEYKDMIDSIRTNKGFYIGRYELGKESSTSTKAVVKQGKVVKSSMSWYQLYLDCKGLEKQESDVTIRMIWGLQWDATCKWLASNDFNITSSFKWGNFKDYNEANGYEVGDAEYIEINTTNGTKYETGHSNYWSACNIYDFAGNCQEWIQEAKNTDMRVRTGGHYGNISSTQYAAASNRRRQDSRRSKFSKPSVAVQL